ncbi:MAG: hypothetical protein HY816_21275 [Candidatus Wallbacteria bacterium]|nr:hypothetical protein [Candidatus Wallbacteria bacterium]
MSQDSGSTPRTSVWAVVLVAWSVFELASGGKLRWSFSTATLDQHLYLMHALFGALIALPALAAICKAITPARRTTRRTAFGVLGLAATGAAATGLYLCLAGSTAQPSSPRDAHMVTSAAVLLLLLGAAMTRRVEPSPEPARSGIAVLGPLLALAIPCAATGLTMAVWPLESNAVAFPEKYFRKTEPFIPSRLKTAHGGALKIESLVTGHKCGECHQEIYKQWLSSSHRQSTISKWYEKQVQLRMDTSDMRGYAGARFCGGCHEPVVMLSGNLDDGGFGPNYPPNKDEGITCVGCHRAVAIRDTVGNGSLVHGANQPYLFQNHENENLRTLGRALVRGKPDLHASDMMRPELKKPDFCATCHQVFFKTLYGKLFLIQNDFDVWKASPYNKGPGHEKTQRCQDCHMPLVDSRDPAAKNGKVHSHRFIGANTGRPFQIGDKEQLARTEEFLQQACYLNVHGPDKLEPGKPARFDVIVTNANVGHNFPGGTTDMVDAWIEAIATDAKGQQLFASGLVDPKTLHVDPASHFYRTVPLDIYGAHLFRRDLWNTYRVKEARLIPPEKSDLATYEFPLPPGTAGPVTFKARLRFRRSNQRFTDYVFTDKQMVIPITDLAEDEVRVSMEAQTPNQDQHLKPATDVEDKSTTGGSD